MLSSNTQVDERVLTSWSLSTGKRALDCTCAVVLLIVAAPLMLLIAALVKITSSGPVFFRQKRVGQSGEGFQLLKFRTMYHSIENGGPLVTRCGDRRVTSVGKWLRKWKLDELPQFINVLKGEMSLVGPRPDMLKYIETLAGENRNILRFRPGITSPATLMFRNEEEVLAEVPTEEMEHFYICNLLPQKVRTDLNYAECATFSKDCRSIWRTVFAIIKHSKPKATPSRDPFADLKEQWRDSGKVETNE